MSAPVVDKIELNGLRGLALLVAGIYALTRALAYLPMSDYASGDLPRALEMLNTLIPIQAWGGIWLIASITCIMRAFSKNDSLVWGILVGLMVIWGLGYSYGWIESIAAGNPNREWVSSASYLGPALIIAVLSANRPGRKKE